MSDAGACARQPLSAAGLLLAAATVAGAVGAHALQPHWPALRMRVYDTAVRYQFYNALGLLGIGLVLRISQVGAAGRGSTDESAHRRSVRTLQAAAWLVFAGIVAFSGSLYALTLGAPRWIGFLTPLGGMALIAGWLVFAYGIWRG